MLLEFTLIVDKFVHPLNALVLKLVTPDGIVILVRDVQFRKALLLIVVTVVGIEMLLTFEQPLNALLRI